MSLQEVVPNGVDGATGGYLQAVPIAEIAGAARKPGIARPVGTRGGLPRRIDARDLGATGWGVVFSQETPAAVREALGVLLRHRAAQAGGRYRELLYRPGETIEDFLARHDRGPGQADPRQLPYYLLLVGGPEAIPFRLQYHLDLQLAVGRIAFETAEEYAGYAGSVVAAEARRRSASRRAALFCTQHPDDAVTGLTADHLVRPLACSLRAAPDGWELETCMREAATKERLGRLLGGDETPDLLFTASHGLVFASGDPRQLRHQGALLCQGWPGPREWQGGPLSPDIFFAAEDLPAGARLEGMLCFHLACFSAGTPRLGASVRIRGSARPSAPRDFLAALPCALLARGALAVIGHVDTVWECSLLWEGKASQVAAFESTLRDLMAGLPVGEAMKVFGERHGEIAAQLVERLERERWQVGREHPAVAALWRASQDARGYVVLGDPAVRLPTAVPAAAVSRRAEDWKGQRRVDRG
jgi:hypothetical protein